MQIGLAADFQALTIQSISVILPSHQYPGIHR
jgi:hypothetical protein